MQNKNCSSIYSSLIINDIFCIGGKVRNDDFTSILLLNPKWNNLPYSGTVCFSLTFMYRREILSGFWSFYNLTNSFASQIVTGASHLEFYWSLLLYKLWHLILRDRKNLNTRVILSATIHTDFTNKIPPN